ncbi:hypothetical protein PCANC_05961 [Puccinia coronata f. sp. avenae]|uniref:L domain-like protein n=2 Tax=Puccinia coronata f. sp. avenae TaxID=200324 RepID=A0A2N5VTX9_9BASI|nr:hypothetical protein PCANC_05961 [Puccinia coronata f. sp. avenae]
MDEPTEENRCEEATKEEEEDNTHAELPAEPASTIPESDLSIEKLISMVETASFLEETHPSDETPHTDGALEENRATQEELPHSEEELVIQDEPRIEPLSQAHLVVDQPMGQEATPILPQELPHSSHPSNPTTKSDQEDLTVEEQPLFNNTPLSDMSMSFDELESLIDHSEITQLKPTITDYQLEDPEELLALNDHQDIFALYEREEMLTSTRPPTELISIPTDVSPENESMDHPQPIKDGPDLPHNPQPNSTQPLRKTFGRPSATSSKILRTASIGQPSKTHPSSSGVSLLRPNPLSVRPEPKNPSKTPLPRSKIPSSIHPSNALTTIRRSPIAKTVSSVSSSTSSVRTSGKTTNSLKASTNSPVQSVQPLNIIKSPHPSAIKPSAPMPKLRTTPSKSTIITPSKPTSSTTPSKSISKLRSTPSKSPIITPSKPTSSTTPSKSMLKLRTTPSKSSLTTPAKPTSTTTPSKSRPINPLQPRSLSSASSSLKKLHSTSNGDTAKMPNLDHSNDSPNDSSPKNPAKSSQALREMLAKAKRSRPKIPTTPNSPDPNSIPGLPSVADQTEALDAWGFPPIEKSIEKAQRNGRLNVSSRMLSKVPTEIYAKLLSQTSIFHPSNRPSSTSNQPPTEVNLKFSQGDEEETSSGVPWYETVDLVSLNLSLNELTSLDDEFGGFEALTNCDLHCNRLTGLPPTFGLLTNLTHLDLSSNELSQLPVQILSLVNLIELNLSKNLLTRLWPLDWKPTLKKQLATAVKPPPINDELLTADQSFNSIDKSFNSTDQPSTIIDSSFSHEEFCDQFPSRNIQSHPDTSDPPISPEDGIPTKKADRHPLPALRRLKLSGNKFTSNSLLGPGSVQLPKNLTELDLSNNPLGGRIDVSNNLRNLGKLSKLNLCSCGLSDEIFWFDLEGDYDQLECQEGSLLEHLVELDISHNGIDSLGPLESFFDRYCLHQPRLTYVGLPRELIKLVAQHGQGTAEVNVMIGNNFLREEARRRRKTNIATAQSSTKPAEDTHTVPDAVADANVPSLMDVDLKSAPEEIKQGNGEIPPPPSTPVAIPLNPTQTMLLKHYNQATYSLNLSALHLTDLSEKSDDYNALTMKMDVELMDLSNNQLSQFPIGIINCFRDTLTVLNLSRNRLTNSSHSFGSHIQSMMGIKLPELVELNLASNFLTGSPRLIVQLIMEGFEAFKLKSLDLSLNQFETLDGFYDLMRRHEILDDRLVDAGSRTEQGRFRMEKLVLDGNRIAQIDDLVRLATEIKHSTEMPSSSAMTEAKAIGHTKAGTQYNFLEEISLSDNSISQLPPVLGFLPTNRLAIARNVFRFPLRKVYDCVGGDVKILAWLRERC